MRRLGAALLLILATSADLRAEIAEIATARALLAEAEVALEQADGAEGTLAALGTAVRAQEAALSAFHAGLRVLAAEEDVLKVNLAIDRDGLTSALRALQSISRAPDSALLVYPGGPVQAARAGSLIGAITPELNARLAAVRTQLAEIQALRAVQEEARDDVRGTLARLQDLRAQSAKALRNRKRRVPDAELAAAAQSAGERARDLSDLTRALGGVRQDSSETSRFEDSRGHLLLPVHGQYVTEGPELGLSIATTQYAQVSAPVDATIRYSGPLIGYDSVIVLEPQAGWLIVLAGMGNLTREVGETVLAGEKIGDMGGDLPASDEFLLAAGDRDGLVLSETLYIEIRHEDETIDPALWFAPGR
ncbi:MAG: peptidoglycan DD-metalloendopeptidase family protein [Pseudomonadota bacterium]